MIRLSSRIRPLLSLTAIGLALTFGGWQAHADEPAVVTAPVASLDSVLAPLTEDRLFRDSSVSLQVVDVATGQEVYAYNADTALNPASTMKVVTAAAALRELGPSYRFTTTLLRDGDVNNEGVLEGDLYVRGTGDPTMVLEKLWKMVYDLKLEGVTEVSGDVVFDRSFMDSEYAIPGWDKKEDIERGPSYFPSLGALSLNFNTVAVVVGPGPKVGEPARAQLETAAPGIIEIENELRTGSKGTRRVINLEREVEGSKMTLKVSGSIPQETSAQRYYRSVPDPTAYFTAAFADMMKQHGIKVRGHYVDGETPSDARQLVELRSPPLAMILMDTNKYSNNFMAEQVLKAVGAEAKGAPGTTAKGLEVVSEYLTELGIPEGEATLINGSGLSRELYLRPTHLTAVLVDMAHDPKVGHEFSSSLAIGGRDGTLWARFRDEDEVDRLRGKTGTLNGVHCLAGYVEAADGREYAFAFLVNDLPYSISRARRVHDRFADIMFGLDAQALAESSP
ncbi:MAG: D-alanyl-D-alanine carboxypeptidase/D-alanyl-D-alanine-endopeptidase [Alphaproteobacteria bacterium]|nr:D-alanyl-D-alanine carboxypeptidase/D-alanyl-D-alanine-endopeptidase [Alphaproteobacteria bacterium]